MTALMVLFLVAMSVAMLAVTNSIKQIEQKNDALQRTANALSVLQKTPEELEIERQKTERDRDIDKLLDKVARAAGGYEGIINQSISSCTFLLTGRISSDSEGG